MNEPVLCIHVALLGVQLTSLEGFGFLVWTRRRRRVERDTERNAVKAKHRNTLLLPRIQWGERTIPGCRSPPRGSFTGFFFFPSCYFHAGPLSQLFLFFFSSSNFTFPSVSVLCQVGSCCHRNHQRLRPLSLSLFRSLSLSICPPSSLSSDVINIYFHATLRRRRDGGRDGEESLSGF